MKSSLQRLAFGAVTCAVSCAVLTTVPARAQSASSAASSAQSPATVAPPAAAHVRTDALTGVKFLSGGVGDDEQQAIKADAAAYPFHLVFSRPDGAFVVADQVTVRDRGRIVLSVSQAGPFLLAKLPPGKYAVDATVGGKAQNRSVEVLKGPHKVVSWATE